MRAPAKINLSLKILRKREDNFHELKTVISPIELADELIFSPAKKFELICETPGVPLDESNLVTKALRLMEKELGKALTWRIELKKNIPHGAGLGGGSSDAATTLMALNQYEGHPLSQEKLVELAAELGSDVACFLFEKTCLCEGRGEIVSPIDSSPKWPILLLKPRFGVSTPDAYRNCLSAPEIEGFSYAPIQLDGWTLENDLQRPVFLKFPFLGVLKSWLEKQLGVRAVLMTGSGSTIFAVLEEGVDVQAIISKARLELDSSLWAAATRILA